MHRLLPPLLVLLTTGCADLFGPRPPAGARPFTPPPVYARWWAMVERCSGRRGDLGAVQWAVVPGVDRFTVGGRQASGYYSRGADRIVLAEASQLVGPVVRHEMLHAVLPQHGHPRGAFLGACAGTVACYGDCARDAGPPPAPDPRAAQVPASTLVLAVEADPARPSIAADGGHFSVTVTVRNPRTTPVVVALPPSGDAGPSVGFRYALDGPRIGVFGDERVDDAGLAQFGPGEVKRWVFDFRGGSRVGAGELPPGTYRVRGGYSTELLTGPAPVEVRP